MVSRPRLPWKQSRENIFEASGAQPVAEIQMQMGMEIGFNFFASILAVIQKPQAIIHYKHRSGIASRMVWP
jgi:hypothetical protein